MRVTIIAVGSRGDAQPYVALGCGLAQAGHDVTVATHETFRDLVTARGLRFAPVIGDPRAVLGTADRWLATGRRRHMLPAAREFLRGLRPLVEQMLADYWRVSQGSDLLVFSAVAAPAWSVAERLGIPGVAALLQPLHRTRAFPAIGVPSSIRLGEAFNRRTHAVTELFAWRPFRTQINTWRRRTLQLPPIPRRGPFARPGVDRPQTTAVYGYSPLVVPRPADWAPHVHVTGYWVLPPDPAWRPDESLSAFLRAGAPPVYIGFGSMTPQRAERLTAIVVAALERTGQRGVLQRSWGALGAGAPPRMCLALDEVPHEWLFARMAALVHHGGAGTTGAALRSGVPSIVIPLSFDQPYWASRVAALGAGPHAVSRRRLTADRLARAIDLAISDPVMRDNAAALGAALRTERGVEKAVDVLEGVVANYGDEVIPQFPSP